MEGWIKFHRRIMGHWVWKSDKYFKAWAYCLFRANHEGNKVLVGSHLVNVARGQFITSRGNFAVDTGMTVRGVRTFFELLRKDEMISIKTTSTMTMITVCNYETYQIDRPAIEFPVTSERPASDQRVTTDKNVKNVKNVKKKTNKVDDYVKVIREKLQEKKSPLVEDRDIMIAIREFVEYRLTAWSHRPFTLKAAQLFTTSLIRHSRNNKEAGLRIITRSIEMGWQGIFELKEDEWQAIYRLKRQDSGTPPQSKESLKQPPLEPLPEGDSKKGREVMERIKKRLTNYDSE